MGYQNREIEKKFVLKGYKTLKEAVKALKKAMRKWEHSLVGDSTDIYFNVPPNIAADFARVRMLPRGKAQLTVKYTDKVDITDRVEIDVTVQDPAQALAFCSHLFGYPAKSVRKKYVVLFLDSRETNVSIYKVFGDKRIFLEVEARSEEKVNKISQRLKDSLDVEREPRSVYQMFVSKRKAS